MRMIISCITALTLLSSNVLAEHPSENMEQRVLIEMVNRNGIGVGDLELALKDCELNQSTLNLCAFQRAIWAELLLDDTIETTNAKTAGDYMVWKEQLQSRCQVDTETGGGTLLPLLISECKELAMLAERYRILGPENFSPPPQPPHKWD
ncbi:hypothetical protein ACLO87_06235 [Paenalcaligenes sp. Me52]|uniref:hypothetical protein n=1 Tax=Paenalcaligenes sp. Me52 TaxID=3392038 RepID=UPI003D2DE2EB